MVTILMMSAKLANQGRLKIKIFQQKGYEVIILEYEATSKIFSRNSNYILDVVMWVKSGNISRKVIITSIL